MANIKVVDRDNPERHLGWLKHDGPRCRGLGFYVHVMTNAEACFGVKSVNTPSLKVFFEYVEQAHTDREEISQWSYVDTTRHWTVLGTEAKLSDLMLIDRFTLPGESQSDAEARRYAARNPF